MAYKEIQKLKEVYKAHTNLHEGKDGMIIGVKEEIHDRWYDYRS